MGLRAATEFTVAEPLQQTVSFYNFQHFVIAAGDGTVSLTPLVGPGGWSIDARAFAGQPTLVAVPSGIIRASRGNSPRRAVRSKPSGPRGSKGPAFPKGALAITLAGARWPGTDVLADFSITITRTVIANDEIETVDATMLLGGFQYSGDASDLLAPLQAPISLGGAVCRLGQAGAIVFTSSGAAMASFRPGTLKIEAGQVGAVSGFGDPLAAGSLILTVLGQDVPSAFKDPPPLRSSVIVGTAVPWRVGLPTTATPIGSLAVLADLYDQLSVEVGEDATGDRRQVAMFTSRSKADQFQLQMGSGITGLDGDALQIALSTPAQLYDFQPAIPHVELWCGGRPLSPWAKSAGTGLRLGGFAPEPFLNVAFGFDDSQSTVLRCTFALLGIVPPFEGAVVGPIDLASFLSILPVGVTPGAIENPSQVLIGSLQHGDVRFRVFGPGFSLLRSEDLLTLDFQFDGMALEGRDGQAPILVVAQAGQPGHLSVTFPPQHLAEQTYDQGSPQTAGPPPIAVRLAEQSRLAFTIPADAASIPLDLPSLLSWAALLPDAVKPGSYLPGERPGPGEAVGPQQPVNETAIELPYRLTLSPNRGAGWSHRVEPVTNGEWTELWHTRLGVRTPLAGAPGAFFVDERDSDANLAVRGVRAVWSPDWPTPAANPFVRSAVTPDDRKNIVANTADFSQTTPTFMPQAVFVRRLMLSGPGGWLDGRGLWTNPANSLAEWRHLAAHGRDQYVRIVHRGHLFPFGHRASLFAISERKFSGDLGGDPAANTAYVFEQFVVVITQPVCRYPDLASSSPKHGRDFPFTEVELTTLVTPTLDPPQAHAISSSGSTVMAFWIYQQGGTPLLFPMRSRDRDTTADPRGRPIVFEAAAIFLDEQATFADLAAAASAYDNDPDGLFTVRLGGQKVVLAASSTVGDTTYEVESVSFQAGAFAVPAGAADDPTRNALGIYPSVSRAAVHLPAVRQLATGPVDQTVPIAFEPNYLTTAGPDFADNVGEVFATLVTPLAISFDGDRATGIAAPDMAISGLSRKLGTVAGDFTQLATGAATPKFAAGDFFKGAAPTLLGGITLPQVIDDVPGVAARDAAPALTVDTSDPTKIRTRLSWAPPVKDGGLIQFTDRLKSLTLESTVVTPVGAGQPDAVTSGVLTGFKLNFAEFVTVAIDRLEFTARRGQKPQLILTLAPDAVQLTGQLDFLQVLMKQLKGLLGGGPSLDIDGAVVKASYALAIPALGIGVFSLQNIRLGVGISVPLSNAPVGLRFNFAEKDHPFQLAISLLGGGGFFAVEATTAGIQRLELAVEAGAVVALDLGVASGSAHVMIGIYFSFATVKQIITGYVRAGGELTILQLVSLHVELYLGLTYQSVNGQQTIWGEASLTIEVAVSFLHKSVTVSMRREFVVSGAGAARPLRAVARRARLSLGAPTPTGPAVTIGLMLDDQDWRDYAVAFA
jgi:hypothetical protein